MCAERRPLDILSRPPELQHSNNDFHATENLLMHPFFFICSAKSSVFYESVPC